MSLEINKKQSSWVGGGGIFSSHQGSLKPNWEPSKTSEILSYPKGIPLNPWNPPQLPGIPSNSLGSLQTHWDPYKLIRIPSNSLGSLQTHWDSFKLTWIPSNSLGSLQTFGIPHKTLISLKSLIYIKTLRFLTQIPSFPKNSKTPESLIFLISYLTILVLSIRA